ncbi:hypothetical protein ELI_0438 [Eubacterium callanderi]|uniref:Uncharacterized protein n=1 Tax=Eubacterium callanderi TaxID=53442 RepID=E3GIH0_9FIRM|nr:hypothetical protein ELI_0438 [Eubacterium callanderi]
MLFVAFFTKRQGRPQMEFCKISKKTALKTNFFQFIGNLL